MDTHPMMHKKSAPARPEVATDHGRSAEDFREDLLLRAALAFIGKAPSDPHKKR